MSEPKIHELKIIPPYFSAVVAGIKRFELRKNDRDFKVGDTLRLCEYEPAEGRYTGNTVEVLVTYILQGGSNLASGMCVMSIENPALTAKLAVATEALTEARDTFEDRHKHPAEHMLQVYGIILKGLLAIKEAE